MTIFNLSLQSFEVDRLKSCFQSERAYQTFCSEFKRKLIKTNQRSSCETIVRLKHQKNQLTVSITYETPSAFDWTWFNTHRNIGSSYGGFSFALNHCASYSPIIKNKRKCNRFTQLSIVFSNVPIAVRSKKQKLRIDATKRLDRMQVSSVITKWKMDGWIDLVIAEAMHNLQYHSGVREVGNIQVSIDNDEVIWHADV